MILITTSRKPSRRTRRFCKALSGVLPLSKYVNRGKASIKKIAEKASAEGYRTVFVVCETKGNPSMVRVLKGGKWVVQIYISVHVPETLEKIDEEDLVVEGDKYKELLKEIFSDYEGKEGVILREKEGEVKFIFGKKEVGPRIWIKGADPVPQKLNVL